jgi:hypothetical protein
MGVALVITSCDLLTVDEDAKSYPTVYSPLERSTVEEMNASYQAANNHHICSTLNVYGFTGFSELFFVDGESPCVNRPVVRIEMTNTDTLEQAAKKALLLNSAYTGVTDTTRLILTNMEPLPGCIICEGPSENRVNIEWKLTYANQRVDTVRVLDTEITVFIDAEGVNRIWGNWFTDFKIPEFVNYGYKDVESGMVGWQIDMRTYTGDESIYTVKAEDITQRPQKVHLQVVDKDTGNLELRTCWSVSIGYSENDAFAGWNAYIDTEEGFLVKLEAK